MKKYNKPVSVLYVISTKYLILGSKDPGEGGDTGLSGDGAGDVAAKSFQGINWNQFDDEEDK